MHTTWTTEHGEYWGELLAAKFAATAALATGRQRACRRTRRAGQDGTGRAYGLRDQCRARLVLRRYAGPVRAALLELWRVSPGAGSAAALLGLVHRYDNGRIVVDL